MKNAKAIVDFSAGSCDRVGKGQAQIHEIDRDGAFVPSETVDVLNPFGCVILAGQGMLIGRLAEDDARWIVVSVACD